MFSPKHLGKCILVLLITGCNSSGVTVFNGSKFQCDKLFETLQHYNIEATRKLEASSCSLKVSKKTSDKVTELFVKLDLSVFTRVPKPNNSLTEILVPVLKKTKSFDSSQINKLKNSFGILDILCFDTEKNYTCTIWFNSSQIDKSQIEIKLGTVFLPSEVEKFEFEDLRGLIESKLGEKKDQASVSEKMIVLDPFSFKVLDREKDIAGAQLILVLGVFLLSGFVLGFWARSKEKSS